MKNIEEFINLYESYNKEDKDSTKNQYNNAFFLREVQKCLKSENNKEMKDKKVSNKSIKGILMFLSKSNNSKSYDEKFEILKSKDIELDENSKNIIGALYYLYEFINAKAYYEKFESYRNLKTTLNELDSKNLNIDKLQIEIDNLIYDIELENNEYILDYNYIEEKLNQIVREISDRG